MSADSTPDPTEPTPAFEPVETLMPESPASDAPRVRRPVA